MKHKGIVWTLFLLALGWGTAVEAQNLGALAVPERQAMSDTLQYALENNPSNQTADWVNPDTGHSGGVVPTRTYSSPGGEPCREFISTIIIAGREEQGYGTACRQPDGTWQVVSDSGGSRVQSAPPPARVYVYTPPERYYYYPSGFYDPYNIFLSFGLVYRHGHHYRGNFYLDGWQFRTRYPGHFRTRIYSSPGHHKEWWRGRGDYRERDRRDFRDDRRRDDRRDRDRGRDWDRGRDRDRGHNWDRGRR
jgi:surface antigen